MKTKLFTLINFLVLFVFWCFLSLASNEVSNGYALFTALIVIFAFSCYLILILKHMRINRGPRGVKLLALGLFFDAVISILGFVFNLQIFILLPLIQFIALIGLGNLLDPEQSVSDSVYMSALLVLFTSAISFVFSGVTLDNPDIIRFLLVYTPLYRTTFVIVSIQYLLKDGLQNRSVWKSAFSLGYAFALLCDLVYYRSMLAGENLAHRSHLFLYLSGTLFLVLAIERVLDRPLSVFDIRGSGITYFKTLSHKIPISLN